LTVNLAALAENWRRLAARAAPGRCAGVVKANGYGLGAAEVGTALYETGCRTFFVAHASEGAKLRDALPMAEAKIFILNGLEPHAHPIGDYCSHHLIPAIGSNDELRRWRHGAPASAGFALHLDTGMRRLGFESLATLNEAIQRHGANGAQLLMSHFVSAEAPEDPDNDLQIKLFTEARLALSQLPASLANSSGLFLRARPIYDLARPGYALYGGNPTPGAPNPMLPVATLEVAIAQTRWIFQGQSCGYNAQWTASRRTRLATVLIGYADGLPRTAGMIDGRRGAEVVIGGHRCKLVGRTSMDLSIADVTDLPEGAAEVGTRAEFFGPNMPLDEFAAQCGTIGYHVLTSLGPRFDRVYLKT
jgi:alanine racemase